MKIEALIERAQELNNKVKEINSERMRKLGEREAAQKALKQKLSEYNAKYGCDYTEKDLATVYTSLVEKFNSDVAALEEQIAIIESGEFVDMGSVGVEGVKDVVQSGVDLEDDASNDYVSDAGIAFEILPRKQVEGAEDENESAIDFAKLAKQVGKGSGAVKFEI